MKDFEIRPRGAGWPFVAVIGAALLTVMAVVRWRLGYSEPGTHEIIQLTARTSAVLFGLGLAAPGLARWRRSEVAMWIATHQRPILVSLLMSHALHAAAIVANRRLAAAPPSLPWFVVVGGALGYLFILVLAATPSDRPSTGARQPIRWLRAVAWTYLWVLFAGAYTARSILESPMFVPLALGLYAAAGLRLFWGSRSSGQ